MRKVKVFGKSITVPSPFRANSDNGTTDYKVKIPKKSKLVAKGITKEQFCDALTEQFNDELVLNGMQCVSSARSHIKRGSIFIRVTSVLDV